MIIRPLVLTAILIVSLCFYFSQTSYSDDWTITSRTEEKTIIITYQKVDGERVINIRESEPVAAQEKGKTNNDTNNFEQLIKKHTNKHY